MDLHTVADAAAVVDDGVAPDGDVVTDVILLADDDVVPGLQASFR
jgi:hypothetical protein